jgi:hypothetical protein
MARKRGRHRQGQGVYTSGRQFTTGADWPGSHRVEFDHKSVGPVATTRRALPGDSSPETFGPSPNPCPRGHAATPPKGITKCAAAGHLLPEAATNIAGHQRQKYAKKRHAPRRRGAVRAAAFVRLPQTCGPVKKCEDSSYIPAPPAPPSILANAHNMLWGAGYAPGSHNRPTLLARHLITRAHARALTALPPSPSPFWMLERLACHSREVATWNQQPTETPEPTETPGWWLTPRTILHSPFSIHAGKVATPGTNRNRFKFI